MSIEIDKINAICAEINFEVQEAYPDLKLHFIIHKRGKLRESIALAEHDLVMGPTYPAAKVILKKASQCERSSFMGLAIHQRVQWFGFKKTDYILGLIHINQDEFDSELDAALNIYHQVWHAIDLYEIRQNPSYRNRFRTGPIIPKRSDMNLSKANLQADIFSAALLQLKQKKKPVDQIATLRATQTLSAVTDIKLENYPTIIAIDACKFLMDNHPKSDEDVNFMHTARRISMQVGQTFDKSNIQQWWDFSIPAQDMAWRGYNKEDILSAAINTSHSPFVRSIGYLVQETTGIEPSLSSSIERSYNAFIDPEMNIKLHKELVDTIFEEAIFQGEEDGSSDALIQAANRQNEALTEGRFLGWCANALQDAAKAFERALINGASPGVAARMQFEGNKSIPTWGALKDLGDSIVSQKREGFAVTMGHIAEICHNNAEFSPVLGSIKMTMSDPSYIQKLEAANDLALKPNTPTPNMPSLTKGFHPETPAPNAPKLDGPSLQPSMPAPTLSMPGMGGSSKGRNLSRERQILAQRMKDKGDNKGDQPTDQS